MGELWSAALPTDLKVFKGINFTETPFTSFVYSLPFAFLKLSLSLNINPKIHPFKAE